MLELTVYAIFFILIIIGIYIEVKLHFSLTHFTMKSFISPIASLDELPSVSVCIPARNEMRAMTECLERVIASTYPKLEIIVLDDSSVDDTSILIKSFAHAGVRFVEGSPLPTGWLGKNYALQTLMNEASGSYILYMDVDTRLDPDSIEEFVSYVKQENAAMISVLPRRSDGWHTSAVFGTLRYFWSLILHRRSDPAVSSSAWMINRLTLEEDMGGFESIKESIQPESKLAALLMEKNAYKFLIGTELLGVSYDKNWRSQIQTSVRLLFPVFGGHVVTNIIMLAVLALVTSPAIVLLLIPMTGWVLADTLALIILVMYMTIYGTYLRRINGASWFVGALLWPYVVFQELVILVVSIVAYLTHSVLWKGRSVRAPHQSRRG